MAAKSKFTPWKIGKRGGKYVVTNLPAKASRNKAEQFHWELGTLEAAEKTYNEAMRKGVKDLDVLWDLAMNVSVAHARASDTAPTKALQRKHRLAFEEWKQIEDKYSKAKADARDAARKEKAARHAARVQSMDLAGEIISAMQSTMPGIARDMFDEKTGVTWTSPSGAYVTASLSGAETENSMGMLTVVSQGEKNPAIDKALKGFRHRERKGGLGTTQAYTLTSMVPADEYVSWVTGELKKLSRVLGEGVTPLWSALRRLEEAVRGPADRQIFIVEFSPSLKDNKVKREMALGRVFPTGWSMLPGGRVAAMAVGGRARGVTAVRTGKTISVAEIMRLQQLKETAREPSQLSPIVREFKWVEDAEAFIRDWYLQRAEALGKVPSDGKLRIRRRKRLDETGDSAAFAAVRRYVDIKPFVEDLFALPWRGHKAFVAAKGYGAVAIIFSIADSKRLQ